MDDTKNILEKRGESMHNGGFIRKCRGTNHKIAIVALAIAMVVLSAQTSFAWKQNHIRTAALTYSLTDVVGADFVGRHYDIAINPSGNNYTAVKNADPDTKCLLYITMSSLRGGDYDLMQTFCNERGYNYDSMFLWANSDVCVSAIAPAAAPCTGDITCTDAGNRLEHCGWTSYRHQPDFRRQSVQEYVWYKYKNFMGSAYDGVMEDECTFYYHPLWDYYSPMMCFPFQPSKWTQGAASDVRGWNGYSHGAIRDSLMHLKQNVWLPALMDSMRAHNKMRFPNPAAYGVAGSDVLDDVLLTGSGILLGEGMHLRPLGGYWNTTAWEAMDIVATSAQGSAIVWCEIMAADSNSLGNWNRCLMERLGWYYMKADVNHFYLLITGNEIWLRHNDYQAKDSLYKWLPAFEHDVGQPLGAMYTAQSGTDGGGQSYTLRARDFSSAIVLYRNASGGNYGNSSAVTYDLGGNYRQLYYDGSLGGITTQASIRNCEGKIYVPDGGSGNVPPTQPSPNSPGYGEVIDEIRPILIVNNAYDSDGDNLTYSYDVSLNSGFTQIVASVSNISEGGGTTTQWQVNTDLNSETTYYWRSRAFDGSDYGNYSSTSMFTISTNSAPGAPSIADPVYGDSIDVLRPTLIVNNSIDTDGDDLTYFFDVSLNNNFTQIVASASNIAEGGSGTTQWQVNTDLTNRTAYYWRCRSYDGLEYSNYSSSGLFTVFINSAPGLPSVLRPEYGDSVNVFQPILKIYNASDPNGDNLTYQFQVYSIDTAFIAGEVGIPSGNDSTGWLVSTPLTNGNTYLWRARAFDGIVYGNFFGFSSFVVHTNGDPQPPVLISPANGDTISVLQPTFWVDNSYDPDGDALLYTFQIFDGVSIIRNITGIAEGSDSTGWQCDTTLSDLSTFSWRSRAFDGHSYSGWSIQNTFNIDVNWRPGAPIPNFPGEGDTVDIIQPQLRVTNSIDPDNDELVYQFQLYNEDTVLVAEAEDIIETEDSTGWLIDALLNDRTKYYWRVRSFDGELHSTWCDISEFLVIIFSQGSEEGYPDIEEPFAGGVVDSEQPVLMIENLNGSNNYYFQVAADADFNNVVTTSPAVAKIPNSTTTSWQVNTKLSSGKMYYWRANAEQGDWSETDSMFVSLGVHVYPNPYRPGRGHNIVTFRNVPENSKIKIATVSGKTIKEFKNIPAGDFQWNIKNSSGGQLATGVYLYIVDSPQHSEQGKIVVIR
ncbi:MAG: T9SS type A sorting domain-containing protein [candidate division Zixibacteria bacterium]|nr:T9SS type A sorting domain-containing protein [candidate division Zixibacteria bacterium]